MDGTPVTPTEILDAAAQRLEELLAAPLLPDGRWPRCKLPDRECENTVKWSELKVGVAYYYDRSPNWMVYADGLKVVVVDDRRYRIIRGDGWRQRQHQYQEHPNGPAVMVDLHHTYPEPRVERAAVPVTHLRGPWEETLAAVQTRREAREKAQRERQEWDRVQAQRVEQLQARGIQLGISAYPLPPTTHLGEVCLSVDDFARLLDLAEQATRGMSEA